MIYKINYQDKKKSIYLCDKCKEKISEENLYKIKYDNKTYHLCNKHNMVLKRWLLKEIENRKGNHD